MAVSHETTMQADSWLARQRHAGAAQDEEQQA